MCRDVFEGIVPCVQGDHTVCPKGEGWWLYGLSSPRSGQYLIPWSTLCATSCIPFRSSARFLLSCIHSTSVGGYLVHLLPTVIDRHILEFLLFAFSSMLSLLAWCMYRTCGCKLISFLSAYTYLLILLYPDEYVVIRACIRGCTHFPSN